MSQHNRNTLYQLTDREFEVLKLMTDALTNREIADVLAVSVETVRMHAKNIYAKLGVSGRQKASLKAVELGLIEPKPDAIAPATHNLPTSTTPFIGRINELQEIDRIMQQGARLITILGAGGMGKTRLAVAYGEQVLTHYKDGVYFVPLDAVATVDGIILQIVERLQIQVSGKSDHKQHLLDYLSNKALLLIIDNWEHLLDGATLITDLLSFAPHITVIATSRERLRLAGETVYRLGGLSIPDMSQSDSMQHSDAVQLIEATAQQVVVGWTVTDENLDDVYALCQLTEGMPLGIILAMSWLDAYPLSKIIKEIQNNLDFLQADLDDMPRRHRSIQAVFEWTWQLLTAEEQAVFMKLSVFRNGCTLNAVEQVIGATPLNLQALINKGLVYRYSTGRYYLHALLRQFADQKLSKNAPVEQDTHNRHAAYYTGVAEDILCDRIVTESADVELENLAIAWCWMVDTLNIDMLWGNCHVYGMVAYQLGRYSDMKWLFDYALETKPEIERLYPKLFGCLSFTSYLVHQYLRHHEKATALYGQGQALFDINRLGDARFEVVYAHLLCVLALRMTAYEESRTLLVDVIAALESLNRDNDPVYQTMLAYAYAQHGHLNTLTPEYTEHAQKIKQFTLKALQLAQNLQHKTLTARIMSNLGNQEFILGNYEQASSYFQQADQTYQQLTVRYAHGVSLQQAGVNAFVKEDYDNARRYLVRSLNIHSDLGPNRAVVSIACVIARWKYLDDDVFGGIKLLAYVRNHVVSPYVTLLLDIVWGDYEIPQDNPEIQRAMTCGDLMSYDALIYDLYAWLED